MDPERRVEGARDYGANHVPRELLEQELTDNAGLLGAIEAQVGYLQRMIENPDPMLAQEDPTLIPGLKQKLGKVVQEKQRLVAEKERIERELSAK